MTPRLELLYDPDSMSDALARAAKEAVLRHARLGQPICRLRDGKVVWIQPEEILAAHAAELARTEDTSSKRP